MSKFIPIKYQTIWVNMSIIVGSVSTILFLFSALFLKQTESFLYLFISVLPIYTGIKMQKSNYALVSKNNIKVFGLFGQLKKEYALKKNENFILKKNRIFISKNKTIIKLKLNNWFVNKHDWNRAIELFETDNYKKITKHLLDNHN